MDRINGKGVNSRKPMFSVVLFKQMQTQSMPISSTNTLCNVAISPASDADWRWG